MTDPQLRRRPRRRARLSAALATLALCAPVLSAPALALGEDGPFDLPLTTHEVAVAPDAVTRIPLTALIEDDAEQELDLTGAVFDDGQLPADLADRVRITEDARSVTVAGEGTWALINADLVFTPADGLASPEVPVRLRVPSIHGSTSKPAELHLAPTVPTSTVQRASAGQRARVILPVRVPDGGSVRLELDGQTPGSSVTDDGRRLVVPDHGTWAADISQPVLTFTPAASRPGQQPDPVRFGVHDATGLLVASGSARVTVPIIADINRSGPYGEDIVLSVGEYQQNVDPSTLRLVPPPGDEGVELSDDGTRAVVPGQGTWTLDRQAVTVTFSPESADVRVTAPISLVGGDADGAKAAPALLSTAYPILLDCTGVGAPGDTVVIDLAKGALDVRPETFAFPEDGQPDGASVEEDGTVLRVPGQGTWSIDTVDRRASFAPEDGFHGLVDPVQVTALGSYADIEVSAELTVLYTASVPVMRDDEARTAPGVAVSMDPLGNDTPGDGEQPLQPASVQLRSLLATNLADLEQGTGKRLVMPGEGEYVVGPDGSITFTPEPGFTGTTSDVEYLVTDADGVPFSAYLRVDVDPSATPDQAAGADSTTGISTLLAGTLPSSPSTALSFATVVLLLLFSGTASLWIGTRMESDRREWKD